MHNETKLTTRIALRSELGLDSGIFENTVFSASGVVSVPAITLEPRWYYNLNKRDRKLRNIAGNSGNFVSLKTTYHPDWFTINYGDRIDIVSDISIVPTWGIRRNIGNHFTYETGIGIGYVRSLEKKNVIVWNDTDVAANLHIRIGYRI